MDGPVYWQTIHGYNNTDIYLEFLNGLFEEVGKKRNILILFASASSEIRGKEMEKGFDLEC